MTQNKSILILILIAITFSCNDNKKDQVKELEEKAEAKPELIKAPAFNKDSAYHYVSKQVQFGYRVPGTEAHKTTGDYLVSTLKRFTDHVIEQKFDAPVWEGKKVPLRNIIASFYPEQKKTHPFSRTLG